MPKPGEEQQLWLSAPIVSLPLVFPFLPRTVSTPRASSSTSRGWSPGHFSWPVPMCQSPNPLCSTVKGCPIPVPFLGWSPVSHWPEPSQASLAQHNVPNRPGSRARPCTHSPSQLSARPRLVGPVAQPSHVTFITSRSPNRELSYNPCSLASPGAPHPVLGVGMFILFLGAAAGSVCSTCSTNCCELIAAAQPGPDAVALGDNVSTEREHHRCSEYRCSKKPEICNQGSYVVPRLRDRYPFCSPKQPSRPASPHPLLYIASLWKAAAPTSIQETGKLHSLLSP